MDNLNITNIIIEQPIIKASLSTLNGSNILISNVDNPNNSTSTIISCTTDSSISIENLDYSMSEASLMLLNNVTGRINKVSIEYVESISSIIQIDDSYNLELISISIENVSSQQESIISLKNSVSLDINSTSISNISQLAIWTINSEINTISNMSMKDCYQGIKLTDHSSLMLDSSSFANIGSSDVIYGGAVQTMDSNITIKNSTFDH